MALVLKQIFTSGSDEIAQNYAIESWHVSQSVDAFTGAVAYDIKISGSLTLTGSVSSRNGFTGSLLGTAATASIAQQVKVTNNATTVGTNYRLVFITGSTLPDPNNDGFTALRFDSGSDGSGIFYTPSTNTLNVGRVSGSNDGNIDFVGTASYAATASVATSATTAQSATNYFPSYVGIDSLTYTASTNPYIVAGVTPPIVYVSQSTDILGLNFFSNTATNGQTVTLVTNFKNIGGLQTSNIEISASNTNIYGKNGISNVISTPGNGTLNTLLGVPSVTSVTFQFVTSVSAPLFPTAGWYVMNYIE